MDEPKQSTLFGAENDVDFDYAANEWRGMPEFEHKDLTPAKSIYVHFASREDMRKFGDLIGQRITSKTQSVWYPEAEIGRYSDKAYIDES